MSGPKDALKDALADGHYGFCTHPPKYALSPHARELCPLAGEIDDCDAFAKACTTELPKPEIPAWLGDVATVLVWTLVVGLVGVALVSLARAFLGRDRQKKADALPAANVASAVAKLPDIDEAAGDAEAAMRLAAELTERGQLDRAMSLYLAASLRALDKRGAIRVAKHRTNGEYVRACSEASARAPLREIVREVDRVEFGKVPPTREVVLGVARRAATLLGLAAFLLGCGTLTGTKSLDDPAGNGLPMDILARSGFAVSALGRSVASMPLPEETGVTPPILVLAVDRVPLDEDAEAHLLVWVQQGGTLLVMGSPRAWPKKLDVKDVSADSRDLVLTVDRKEITGARVAWPRAFDLPRSEVVGKLGDKVYAARKSFAKGVVLGVAGDDLFTNVGVARPDNAVALVTLMNLAADYAEDVKRASDGRIELRVAGFADGMSSSASPFSALAHAGLTKAMAHGLAACVLLFLAYGIRRARPRPAAPAARRAFAEHVEATGAFYARANAWPHALAAYGRFADMHLRERAAKGMDPATFLASRGGVDRDAAAAVHARATSAKDGDPVRGDERATIEALRKLLAKT